MNITGPERTTGEPIEPRSLALQRFEASWPGHSACQSCFSAPTLARIDELGKMVGFTDFCAACTSRASTASALRFEGDER